MSSHDTPLLLGTSPEEALVHCVFIHGRTQSPEDMQEQVISKLKSTAGVAFVLPRARGNSWYAARATDALTGDTRKQLEFSVAHIRSLIAELPESHGHARPLVLAGPFAWTSLTRTAVAAARVARAIRLGNGIVCATIPRCARRTRPCATNSPSTNWAVLLDTAKHKP